MKALDSLREMIDPTRPIPYTSKTWGEMIRLAIEEMEAEAEDRERKAFEAGFSFGTKWFAGLDFDLRFDGYTELHNQRSRDFFEIYKQEQEKQ